MTGSLFARLRRRNRCPVSDSAIPTSLVLLTLAVSLVLSVSVAIVVGGADLSVGQVLTT